MAKTDPDQTAVDLLTDHEAERQDNEAKMVNAAKPRARKMAKHAVARVARKKPSKAAQTKSMDEFVKEVLLDLASHARAWRGMVVRQSKEKKRTFAKRTGKKLTLPKITKARIEERREVKEKARTQPTQTAAPESVKERAHDG